MTEANRGTTGPAVAALGVLRSLRSVRRFRPDPVPDADLRAILEVARWCGSAKNTQPWQFVVVREPATRTALARLGPYTEFFAAAPLLIAVVMDGEGTGFSFDCGRVTQNLLLAAHAHGIASCNAGLVPAENRQAAMSLLDVPAGHSLGVVVALGYRAPGDQLAPEGGIDRRGGVPPGRKPLRELVHYERFGRPDPPAAPA